MRTNSARFVFDGGSVTRGLVKSVAAAGSSHRGYTPMGINQAWTEKETPDYPGMFGLMKQNSLNWVRVWMCFWDNKALDWAAERANNVYATFTPLTSGLALLDQHFLLCVRFKPSAFYAKASTYGTI